MPPSFVCKLCDKSFNKNFNLKRHTKKVHYISLEKDVKGSFRCCLCQENFNQQSYFFKHCLEKHDITVKTEEIRFENEEKFDQWKKQIELDTKTCYIRKTIIQTKLPPVSKTAHFRCNRSGFFTPKPTDNERKREIKMQGSRKINGYCPSEIKVQYFIDGKVTASYCSTHVGHKTDLAHLPLSRDQRESMATDVASKVPFDAILENVRSTVSGQDLERIHLLTKQDLYNIEAEFGLNNESVRHSNDATSVDAWVAEESKSTDSCVLLYKPQNENIEEHNSFKENDFALGIMTPAQEEILKKFGHDCICIDGTHGLNAYDFEVVTLMVIDDMRQGFPCAFFICNRIDKETIGAFLKSIKERVGILQPSVFMSDMADLFYNGWLSVMSPVERRLYCTWHVDRAWQNNLSKINNKEKRSEVYKKLRTLLEETDEDAFSKLLPVIVQSLCDDEDTQRFGEYFQKYYGGSCKQWAYCFRKNAGINTNMHLERMHRTIKHLYLKGKTVKRLDKSIHAIMQMTKQKLFDRLTILEKGKVTTKVKELRSRHKTSMKLNPGLIVQNTDASWEIASSSNSQTYTVRLVEPNCKCRIVCRHCTACIHKYSCTCIDACIKWNMCKHIHLLCRMLQSNQSNDSGQQPALTLDNDLISSSLKIDEDSDIDEKIAILEEVGKKEDNSSFEVRKTKLIQNFKQALHNIKTMKQLRIGEQNLKSFLSHVKATESCATLPTVEPVGQRNIQPQRRLLSLKKRNKNKATTKRPTIQEAQCIAMKALLESPSTSNHEPGTFWLLRFYE